MFAERLRSASMAEQEGILARERGLRALYHQRMPRSAAGGRKVVYCCPFCDRVWFMDGRQADYVRLEAQRMSQLLNELEVQAALPLSPCRICAFQLGGMCKVEAICQWNDRRLMVDEIGYRLTWAGSWPVGAHMICVVGRLADERMWGVGNGIPLFQELLAQDLDVPIFADRVQKVMAWSRQLIAPVSQDIPYTASIRERQAQLDPPGHRFSDERLVWRGSIWMDTCPDLGGDVLVSLALALPWGSPCPISALVRCWKGLLPAFEAVYAS